MKPKEAIKVLQMFTDDVEVELVFPDVMRIDSVQPKNPKPMTEGEMAMLPMYDPCPGCRPGGVCRTPSCGRLKQKAKQCLSPPPLISAGPSMSYAAEDGYPVYNRGDFS